METISRRQVTFDKLFSFFTKASDNRLQLDKMLGRGYVQIYKPEKGIQVRIWDCTFFEGIELNNPSPACSKNSYFNLAYFLDAQQPAAVDTTEPLHLTTNWNNMFVSSASVCKLVIAHKTRCRCVSVSFSRRWLADILKTNCTLQVINNMEELEKLKVFQCMTPEEKSMLETLLSDSAQNEFKTFFIKTAVLTLLHSFLSNIKITQTASARNTRGGILDKVEQYLCQHITKEFPGTKELAQLFSMCESTLKRQFKKKFGISISAYVITKKMQYARELMQQKNIKMTEAARLVGYRSVQSFKEVFRKHYGCIPVQQRQ